MAHPGGRPTDYREEYNEQAYKLCLLGATDKNLADFFEVTETTINNWKTDYPKFFESIKKGKEIADANVADRLYQRAMGYTHPELITATFQGKITDTMEVEKHYPPDPTAAIFWLKNRQKERWRDKQEQEISNPPGESFKVTQDIDISQLSDQELPQFLEYIQKINKGKEKT
jgi:hypothetical protein